MSASKGGLLCMKEPDLLKLAGEDENNTLCCHCHFLWIAKDWHAGWWVWRLIGTTISFVPRAGVMSTSIHLSSQPLSMSFIHLAPPLLPTARAYISHIDKACLWHINLTALSRAAVKERPRRSWAEVIKWRRNRDAVLLPRSWLLVRPGM